MALTGAQRQAQYIAKRNATFKRYEAALREIGYGFGVSAEGRALIARNALNGDTSHD